MNSDIEKLFNANANEEQYVISASVRPDGKYAIAIMGTFDPDFPELWLADLQHNFVKELKSTHDFGIIDWPGEKISWPNIDFSPIAFDRINGYTCFDISVENATFDWKGKIERDDIVSEEWWIKAPITSGVRWSRIRIYSDKSGQMFSSDGGEVSYDYFLDYQDVKEHLETNFVPININKKGQASVGRCSAWVKDLGKELAPLLKKGAIVLPDGDSDAEIGKQLFQEN